MNASSPPDWKQLWLRFPFHIAGIHSDNGSEFINHHLARWCNARQITFTRGRSSHKNDQAHVEQKNWSVVRRHVGYFRYDTRRELDLLNQLWPLASLQVNLFLPQQKLLTKTRTGATVRKTYDTATTPLDRLLTHHPDLVDPHDRQRLTDLLARHRHPRRAAPDRRHPGQPDRTRPPPRPRPAASQDQRRLPQPPQTQPAPSGQNPMSQRLRRRGHLDMSHQDGGL